MHFESVGPRHLLAATGLDPTFGTHGTATLPGVILGDAVVDVPGGLFVEARAVDKGKLAGYVYRLTDAGQVVTPFGQGGRIAAPNFGIDTLLYDKKYDLLYAAGVTRHRTNGRNDANGNTATLRIERFIGATGVTDTSFGDGGVASFAFGRTNTSVAHSIDIGKLVPLAKRGLAVAFEHTSYQTTPDGYGDTGSTSVVTLLKYDADGTRDNAFARRGIRTVTSGLSHDGDRTGFGEIDSTFDTPAVADLQARADGSLRVLVSRDTGTSTYTNDDLGATFSTYTSFVQSFVYDHAGVADTSRQRTWKVGRSDSSDASGGRESGAYRSLLVQADGDDGVIAVGSRVEVKDLRGEVYTSVTQAVSLSPSRRPIYTVLRSLDDQREYAVLPWAGGYYAVDNRGGPDGGSVAVQKLLPTFAVDPAFNDGKETYLEVFDNSPSQLAVDSSGRLLALHVDQIDRIGA